MKAVIQRVKHASVVVDGVEVGACGEGLMILLGVAQGDSEEDARLLTLRFGLEGGMPLTPEDAGRKLGLTPEEVVAREARALAQLRNS